MATQRICSVEGCGKKHVARGMCKLHWQRESREGFSEPASPRPTQLFFDQALHSNTDACILWPFGSDTNGYPLFLGAHAHRMMCASAHGAAPNAKAEVHRSCSNRTCLNPKHLKWGNQEDRKSQRQCSIPSCGKPHKGRGMCVNHYRQWRLRQRPRTSTRTRRGDPLKFLNDALASATPEACVLWPFNKVGLGYGRVYFRGAMHLAHRVVCLLHSGDPPTPEHHAAHNCGSHACINRHHLRWATKVENEADKIAQGRSLRGRRKKPATTG